MCASSLPQGVGLQKAPPIPCLAWRPVRKISLGQVADSRTALKVIRPSSMSVAASAGNGKEAEVLPPDPVGFFAIACHHAKVDFLSYLDEFVHYCGYSLSKYGDPELAADKQHRRLCQVITHNDIVMFSKKGCGFCERAKNAIDNATKNIECTYLIEDVSRATRHGAVVINALLMSLKLGDMTFPQICIRGRYVGGSDDVVTLIRLGELESLLAMDRARCEKGGTISWEENYKKRTMEPKIFRVPRMTGTEDDWYPDWPWYAPQLCMWSNLVRKISVLQLAMMIPALILYKLPSPGATEIQTANALVLLLIIDCGILTVNGPAPFSPTGLFATYIGWATRGNAVSALPYKVIWGIMFAAFLPIYLSNDHYNLSITLGTFIANSIALAVLRF